MEQWQIDVLEREKQIEKRLSLIEKKLKILGADEEYEAKLKELAAQNEEEEEGGEEKPLEISIGTTFTTGGQTVQANFDLTPKEEVDETPAPSGSTDETQASDDKAGQQ